MAIGGLNRALFRAMIPTFIGLEWTSTAMTNQALRMGVSYRRTNMLADIREFTGLMRHETAIRATPSTVRVAKFDMTEVDLRRARRYRGFADATYRNIETGEQVTKPISFYDDELRTEDEWSDVFDEDRRLAEYKPGEELVGFTLTAVEHQSGWDY